MRSSTFLRFSLASCVLASVSLAADDLPKPQAFARYEPMMNKSPFAVATAMAPPPPPAPNFAKDLYIANAAKLADEGVVTLNSNVDKNLKEYLSTKAPNKSGYSISNIEWSDRVGATKVTITKDGQFATLTFNQALLSQPVASGGVPQAQTQPAVQVPGVTSPQVTGVPPPVQNIPAATPVLANPAPVVPNTVRPAPIPTLPTPPPRVRGVIQRNPNGNAANIINQGSVPQAPSEEQ
jgi:hypothetical protein